MGLADELRRILAGAPPGFVINLPPTREVTEPTSPKTLTEIIGQYRKEIPVSPNLTSETKEALRRKYEAGTAAEEIVKLLLGERD